jgi:hypothetical protein
MDFDLNLRDAPRGATITNLGVEFHHPSMLFWVKAGIGFTIGAIVTYSVAWLLYIILLANVMLGLVRAFSR